MIGKEIHEFKIKAMAKSEAKIKKAFIGLSTDIIMDTPVLSGRLRNNWFTSVNKGTNETTESTSNQAINRVNAVKFKLGDTLYFTNNLPYAERIEFQGWSAKAPQGMVRRNILRWSKYFA
jgi:hypothetical protein